MTVLVAYATARAKQVMMNAVNDRDSPVFALWPLR